MQEEPKVPEQIPLDLKKEAVATQLLPLLFDKSSLAVAVLHVIDNAEETLVDFNFIYVNEAFAQMMQKDRQSLMESPYDCIFQKGEGQWLIEYWGAVWDEVQDAKIFNRDSGRHLSVKSHSFAPGYCISFFDDISNNYYNERDMRISQDRLKFVLQHSIDIVFDYDPIKRRIWNEENVMKRFGLPALIENIPEGLLEQGLVKKEGAEAFMAMAKRLEAGEQSAECEMEFCFGKQGVGFQWYHTTISKITNAETARAPVIGFMKNINKEKLATIELQERAANDALTGLLNKGAGERLIRTYLQKKANAEGKYTMFIIDVDNFKHVNDTFGHYKGDLVLKQVAELLRETFRKEDIVYRLGGDEFVVFALHVGNIRFVKRVCNRLVEQMQSGDLKEFGVTLSVGVAISSQGETSYENMYCAADKAMYRVKRSGKNNFKYEFI